MSLDVYLTTVVGRSSDGSGIYVRENGSVREITRAEWDERFPGKEPVVVNDSDDEKTCYSGNITHNLARMADQAGIYGVLWRPEENGVFAARFLIQPLRDGLKRLKDDPDHFRQFNPENGWGDYDGLVAFVEQYLRACEESPDATVNASR